ncbi:MAG: hypothetical protein GXY65_00235 [Rhodococcus sp.]|uniref:hypothetical protein n=1 Tax=Rhodococcus sp. TaxID=1831 RepID=UPI0016B536E5|nr:hypothetical protein [Rhodococcus sp. (in: high G+C Gram-positive bacteria)]NLV77778.1 hypothetical protein [Rhodococcus sp. (in: high G+C Gram-positive bacteria)]
MTTPNPAPCIPEPADIRRAAALLMHTDPDGTLTAGVDAILTEAHDLDRITQLIVALCAVTYGINPALSTPAGKAGLHGIITDQLTHETNGTPTDD